MKCLKNVGKQKGVKTFGNQENISAGDSFLPASESCGDTVSSGSFIRRSSVTQ